MPGGVGERVGVTNEYSGYFRENVENFTGCLAFCIWVGDVGLGHGCRCVWSWCYGVKLKVNILASAVT